MEVFKDGKLIAYVASGSFWTLDKEGVIDLPAAGIASRD